MAQLYRAIILQEAIKQKRNELHAITKLQQSLIHPDVVQVSQQLDVLIVQAQREHSNSR